MSQKAWSAIPLRKEGMTRSASNEVLAPPESLGTRMLEVIHNGEICCTALSLSSISGQEEVFLHDASHDEN